VNAYSSVGETTTTRITYRHEGHGHTGSNEIIVPPGKKSDSWNETGHRLVRMKTILDLVGEFAVLNDAKVEQGGRLPEQDEKRFQELKGFYDLLMSYNGITSRRVTRRFSAADVLSKVTARERLRVPLETEMVFEASGELFAGLVVNISRGGVFLSSGQILPVETPLTLYLASPDAVNQALIETPGQVVWATEHGISDAMLPAGMGVHFKTKRGLIENYLDAMVIDALVRHLSGVDANALAPEFIGKELVEL
jgi:PilZ domain